MSDYLGHLLERSFAASPEVRPQIPSLFEPKPAGEKNQLRLDSPETYRGESGEKFGHRPIAERGTEIPIENAHDPETNELTPIKKRGRAPRFLVENPEPDNFITSAKKPGADPLIASIARPALHTGKSVLPLAINPVQPSSGNKTPEPSPIERPPSGKPDAQIVGGSEIRAPKASQVVVDFHIDDSARRHEDQRLPSPTQKLQPRITPVVPPEIKPTGYAKPSSTLPRAVPSSSARNHGREESGAGANPSLPPSIQVTIGRVEIRAVNPAPAIVRAAPRKESGMSLENYLQRRAGGGSS